MNELLDDDGFTYGTANLSILKADREGCLKQFRWERDSSRSLSEPSSKQV